MSEALEATNPVAEDEATSEAPEVADEANAQGDDLDETEEGTGDDADNPDPDLDEIELEGKKYKVPKQLIQERMLQADYTRKTQELAEQRKAAETERTRQAESFEALRTEHVRVHTLESQIAAYQNVDWQTALAADPDNARIALDQYRALQITLEDAKRELSTKEQQRLDSQRQAAAKAIEETDRVLSREIKGWSPQLARELVTLAGEYGVTQDDLLSNPNPRDFKILHELHTLRQQVKKQTTAQRQQAATAVTPAKTVTAKSSPPTGLDDRLSTEEWVRRRNAQEAAKLKATGRR